MRHEGAYGWLVGSAEKVMMVLKDDGRHYSAAGYGPRMAETVGTFYLGQDDVGPYDGHAELGQAVNDAVEKHLGDERSAYALARDTATRTFPTSINCTRPLSCCPKRKARVPICSNSRVM